MANVIVSTDNKEVAEAAIGRNSSKTAVASNTLFNRQAATFTTPNNEGVAKYVAFLAPSTWHALADHTKTEAFNRVSSIILNDTLIVTDGYTGKKTTYNKKVMGDTEYELVQNQYVEEIYSILAESYKRKGMAYFYRFLFAATIILVLLAVLVVSFRTAMILAGICAFILGGLFIWAKYFKAPAGPQFVETLQNAIASLSKDGTNINIIRSEFAAEDKQDAAVALAEQQSGGPSFLKLATASAVGSWFSK